MLALLSFITVATQLPLDVVSGVRLGDTQETVVAAWQKLGPVSAEAGVSGGTDLKAGTNSATICNGRVVNVSHEMGSDFTVFANVAQWLSKAYGPAKSPEVFALSRSRPATDPRGGANIDLGVLRLRWDAAPGYLLGYSQLNGKTSVVETLVGENACEPRK